MLNERIKNQINNLTTEHLKYEIEVKKLQIARDTHLTNMNAYRQKRIDYMTQVLETRPDKDIELKDLNWFLQECLEGFRNQY